VERGGSAIAGAAVMKTFEQSRHRTSSRMSLTPPTSAANFRGATSIQIEAVASQGILCVSRENCVRSSTNSSLERMPGVAVMIWQPASCVKNV
jgi:hypothetical protein